LEWSNLPLYRITHIAEQFFIKSQNDNLHALRTGLIINKKRFRNTCLYHGIFFILLFFNCFMSVLMDRKSIIIETSTDKLLSHLLSNFLSKILFLLLKAFTSLETNEFFNCNFSAVCFGYFCYILCYCLFSVLSFYINLIK
jgi:hypothetical protein